MRLLKSAVAFCLLTAGLCSADPVAPIDKGQKVFTAGNSFHAWFVAPIIKNIAELAGIKDHVVVGESKIGGSKAIQHWVDPDDKNEAKKALAAGSADVLTLACMLAPDEGIEKFAALGFEHNKDFRLCLQEFWIPFDKFEWPFKGDESKVNADAATAEFLDKLHAPYFAAMDDYVVALNKKFGKPVVFVTPAGQAVVDLRKRIIAGAAPGIKKQSDLFTDKLLHPAPPLEALISYVNFAVIYRRSPQGLGMPDVLKRAQKKHPEWDEKLNALLQEIAWKQATAHPLSGVTAK
jgi:hypothetical protein